MRTYGRVSITEKSYCIEAEPHILAKLKRLFPKIDKKHVGKAYLTQSFENARDLEWFCGRHSLDFDADAFAKMTDQAREFDRNEQDFSMFLRGDYKPPEIKGMAIPPREYQAFATTLYLKRKSLLLGDDLGLGKTCTSIASFTEPATLPAIVVTMTHLQRQWAREVNKFIPHLKPHVARVGTPYDLRNVLIDDVGGRFRGNPDVFILNYHKVSGWADYLAEWGSSIIFDECQELRKTDSLKYAASKGVADRMKYRLGTSATSIFNFGGELFNILNVISPGCLGEANEFYREWCNDSGDNAIVKEPKVFGSYLRENGIMLRRTRADVKRELPPVQKIVQEIDADQKALDSIKDAAHELAKRLLAPVEAKKGDKMNAAEQLSNVVRQATGLAKAPHVADFVRLLVESGEKVVLVGWHRAVYEVWKSRLHALRVALYTGSESAPEKDAVARSFMEGSLDVLILSLRSGAGLDGLQTISRTMVFGELDWSPAVHGQCIGRLNRDGQTDGVTAYFMVSDTGSDPIMADVLGLKLAQADGIVDPHAELIEDQRVDEGAIKRLAEGYLLSKK